MKIHVPTTREQNDDFRGLVVVNALAWCVIMFLGFATPYIRAAGIGIIVLALLSIFVCIRTLFIRFVELEEGINADS